MEDELEDYVECVDDITSLDHIKESNRNNDSFPELWEMEMEALQIENSLDNVERGTENYMTIKPEPYLIDYVETEYNITHREKVKNENIRENDSFPELWDMEMEALQIENKLDNAEHAIEHPTISNTVPYLEDYAESENETEQQERKNELNEEHKKDDSFPPMWELELEILSCDHCSYPDEFKNTDKLISSKVDCVVSEDLMLIESASLQSVEGATLTTSLEEVIQTESMLEKLIISST